MNTSPIREMLSNRVAALKGERSKLKAEIDKYDAEITSKRHTLIAYRNDLSVVEKVAADEAELIAQATALVTEIADRITELTTLRMAKVNEYQELDAKIMAMSGTLPDSPKNVTVSANTAAVTTQPIRPNTRYKPETENKVWAWAQGHALNTGDMPFEDSEHCAIPDCDCNRLDTAFAYAAIEGRVYGMCRNAATVMAFVNNTEHDGHNHALKWTTKPETAQAYADKQKAYIAEMSAADFGSEATAESTRPKKAGLTPAQQAKRRLERSEKSKEIRNEMKTPNGGGGKKKNK